MKQDELVAFVEALAQAEKAAQEKISRAEADARAQLESHASTLVCKYAKTLEALAGDWDEKEKQAVQRVEKEIAAMHRQTERQIAAMRKQHAHVLDSLIHWAVDRVTTDA